VVHQVQDFKDEWDQYQEHEAEDEEALMQTFLLPRGSSPRLRVRTRVRIGV
jgi:hypothetical protein